MTDAQINSPVLVSIPHGSTFVPPAVREYVALTDEDFHYYSDAFTDQIYDVKGVHVLHAGIARLIIDINRAPDDVSQEYALAEEGVMVHMTHDGDKLYKNEVPEALAKEFIHQYHDGYHEQVDAYMTKIQFLIDGHSYGPVGPKLRKDSGQERPDFNIGNLRYSSCSREHTVFFRDFFKSRGFSASINVPYAGGYVLAHHCHRRRIPGFLVPGVQLEINQKLYTEGEKFEAIPKKISEYNALMQEMVDTFKEQFFPETQAEGAQPSSVEALEASH